MPLRELTVAEARVNIASFAKLFGPPEFVAYVDHLFIHGPTADLPIVVYTPAGGGPFPVVVYFHNSGWVMGNVDISDTPCRALGNRSGCVVVSVNYQKAPEHKFPEPLDDAYAATCWVAAHALELDIDANRLLVMGDGTGANLAAAVCLMSRAAGIPHIAGQVLMYPALLHGSTYPSMSLDVEGLMFEADDMAWFWEQYLRVPADGQNPLASPLLAASVAGLPPAFVATAEFDVLRDEGEAYAERLSAEGTSVHLHRYVGMMHGFYGMSAVLDTADELLDDIAAWISNDFGEYDDLWCGASVHHRRT